MATKPKADWEQLRCSQDYRAFLKSYIASRGLKVSDLARAAGFARGSACDILNGRRRLTAKTFFSYEKALKLPQPGKKLFRYLVAQSEPDLFPEIPQSKILQEIEKLRSQAWMKERRTVQNTGSPDSWNQVLKNPHALSVYAASGGPGRGATIDQIAKRTSLSFEEGQRAVLALQAAGLLRIDPNTRVCEPEDMHLFVQTLGRNAVISQVFKRMSEAAAIRSQSQLDSKEEFFFASSFCIHRDRLPELKTELRKLILSYVDDAISADGDQVVHLLTSLFL